MDGRLRNRRLPAVVLLLLCAAPPCAEAQQFVCRPIVRGDSPSRLARQLTGDAAAAYTHAFQIRDPARQMFVPKSQYRRGLSTHWQACVAIGPVKSVPLAYAPDVALAAPVVAAATPAMTSAPLAITSAPLVITLARPAITSAPLAITGPPIASARLSHRQRDRGDFVFIAKIGSAVVLMLS